MTDRSLSLHQQDEGAGVDSVEDRPFHDETASLPPPTPDHLDSFFTSLSPPRSMSPSMPLPLSGSAPGSAQGSAPGSAPASPRRAPDPEPRRALDLRALEYVADYDTHLMCPICHVPFLEPVVLECDHTFCNSCLLEYSQGCSHHGPAQCPTCRAAVATSPRRASRLIVNMCNEIRVRCPNEGCPDQVPRGYVDRHATKECPHQWLACPDPRCEKKVKRKNHVPDQCIHATDIECDCGAVIELGRGDWLRHRDEECPRTGTQCESCGQRYRVGDTHPDAAHVCLTDDAHACPGRPFGCRDTWAEDGRDAHVESCPLARLAPYLHRQDRVLQSLHEQLALTKVQNDVLETGLTRLSDLIATSVMPQLARGDRSPTGDASDIEEIERDHIPSALWHRDLLMPAHLRALTPSPDPDVASLSQTQHHLLALHESLRGNVATLEHDMSALSNTIADLDARTSMQLMNETLRIKEDLAHTNAALFSTRAQVQWLLNRERIGQQQQAMGLRGRPPSAQPASGQLAPSASARSSMSEGVDAIAPPTASTSETYPSSSTMAPSPNFRPEVRRLSGSQERVKL